MPRRSSTAEPAIEPFGPRLARIRQGAGITQLALAEATGLSQRMIAYWEGQASRPPPADQLARMALVLGVSTDELLGHGPAAEREPISRSLVHELMLVTKLPPKARRCALAMIRGLAEEYGLAGSPEADTPARRPSRPRKTTKKKRRTSRR